MRGNEVNQRQKENLRAHYMNSFTTPARVRLGCTANVGEAHTGACRMRAGKNRLRVQPPLILRVVMVLHTASIAALQDRQIQRSDNGMERLILRLPRTIKFGL